MYTAEAADVKGAGQQDQPSLSEPRISLAVLYVSAHRLISQFGNESIVIVHTAVRGTKEGQLTKNCEQYICLPVS